jgi:hypothetical protein
VHRHQPWQDVATSFGLTDREIERMATAFEHDDAELAASLVS